MRRISLYIFICVALPFLFAGCGAGTYTHGRVEGDTITSTAEFLTMIDCGGWTAVEIRAPWADSVPIGRYAVIKPDSRDIDVPPGFVKIHAPVARSVVFSSAYTSAINELGRISAVNGVADGSYYLPSDTVAHLISRGTVVDVGSSMAPMTETIVDLSPDVVLLSPYAGISIPAGLERTGIPLVWMADYLERTPLGRAEWILLLGELYGKSENACKMFKNVKNNYGAIKVLASETSRRPTVITERPMSGVWYVPGGKSYVAQMIMDAGGNYPWSDNDDCGSMALDEASVIDRGAEADLWLIKDACDYSAGAMKNELPRAGIFKAFPDNVYFCNTISKPYYDVVAFHPDRLLADYARIMHPELFSDTVLEFYSRLK